MTESDYNTRGYGSMSFTLGDGGHGSCGSVHLILTRMPLADEVVVEWSVHTPVPSDVRQRIEQHALAYLQWYWTLHTILLHATITAVHFDRVRQEAYERKFKTVFHPDYERAVRCAVYEALSNMSLPLPQLFALSTEEDMLE